MADEAIDQPNLEAWFSEHVPRGRPAARLRAHLRRALEPHLRGRRRARGTRWALRRPPLGKRLASAHDMAREHRIISALQGDRRPRAAGGRPVRGRVRERRAVLRHGVRRRADPALANGGRGRASTRPSGARSASASSTRWSRSTRSTPTGWGSASWAARQDYVARQLRRWHGQWEKSKTHEVPLIDDVHRRLSSADSRAGAGDDRPRRLPARQHDPQRRRARSPRSSTGSSARSATRSPTSACCSSTGPSPATS